MQNKPGLLLHFTAEGPAKRKNKSATGQTPHAGLTVKGVATPFREHAFVLLYICDCCRRLPAFKIESAAFAQSTNSWNKTLQSR